MSDVTKPACTRVCVVILNWNQPELTSRCLDHVLAQEGVSLEPLVIDNGSTKENVHRLEQLVAGRCRILALPTNHGFAGGMNAGIRYASREGHEYVWLLNSDAFPEPDCLARLIEPFEDSPRLALVTPRLHDVDGKEQHAGAVLEWEWMVNRYLSAVEMSDPGGSDTWLTGTALLGRVNVLEAVGEFDESLFAYWEDVDLGLRLAAAGYEFRAAPAARCLHLGGASTGGPSSQFGLYMYYRNGWYVLRKCALHRTDSLWLRLFYTARTLWFAAHSYSVGDRAGAVAIASGLSAAVARGEVGKPVLVPCRSRWWAAVLWLLSIRRCRIELNRLGLFAGRRTLPNRVRYKVRHKATPSNGPVVRGTAAVVETGRTTP
jgi:N-acetylglucosaminyl-diphospho-decaprenol L-rhamnosyltransferase